MARVKNGISVLTNKQLSSIKDEVMKKTKQKERENVYIICNENGTWKSLWMIDKKGQRELTQFSIDATATSELF